MFATTINRVQPTIAVDKMVTHAIFAPTDTHFRKATCEEFGCLAYHNGWTLDTAGLSAELIAAAKTSGRRYHIERAEDTGAEVLHFEAGQACFKASEHRIRLDRPEIFLRRRGDWRGNPDPNTDPVVFSGADSFVDSLRTNLELFED